MGTEQVTFHRNLRRANPLIALAIAAGALTTRAYANDSAFSGIPGSPELKQLKGEHPAIRMVSEKVVLTTGKTSFDTSANFIFSNESPKRVTVTMGFPEQNYGDGWEGSTENNKSGFTRFATWVDGVRVSAKRTPVKDDYDAFWLKTVTFAPRQTRHIRVAATSPYGGNVEWGFANCVSYSFTGGNWKGKVDESDLEIRIAQPGLWNAVGETFGPKESRTSWKPTLEMQGKTAVLKRTWRNWEAQSTVYIGITPTLPFWMVEPDNGIGVFSPGAVKNTLTFRTGGVAGEPDATNAAAAPIFLYHQEPMIALWYLSRRLDNLSSDLPEGHRPKISQVWQPKTHEVTLQVGTLSLGFQAGRPTMNSATKTPLKAEVKTVILPLAPLTIKDEQGQSMLYVPLAPIAKFLGLTFKTDLPHRQFSLGRGTWLSGK